ncbi:MAG TPA: diacylglycerol kinase family protein [Dehalococcoidia bacterium]|nr:diacylglycerol kinase family protein [Dehalococcoidia bacterium]
MTQRLLIIVNPVSHNLPSRHSLDEADLWLREQGWQVRWEQTERPGHATGLARQAADEQLPLVITCGGDGTLREAACGLVGSETALAPLPAGTVNIWAREVRIPRKPSLAVRAIINGERRRVDLGRAGQEHFLLMAGIGLDAVIASKVSLRFKRRAGALAYAVTAARETSFYRGKPVTLDIDGERLKTRSLMMVIGNTRNYAGLTSITRHAFVDDGLLDVCVFPGAWLADVLPHVARVIFHRHLASSRVIYRKARRIVIESGQPLPMQLDGDPAPEDASTIEVVPRALVVQVPRDVKSPIFLP